MANLHILLKVLSQNHTSSPGVTLERLTSFVTLVSQLKNEILLAQPSTHPVLASPAFLPPSVVRFLSQACGIDEVAVAHSWDILRDLIWMDASPLHGSGGVEAIFQKHGHALGFRESPSFFSHLDRTSHISGASSRALFPPSHKCMNPLCNSVIRGLKLQKAEQRAAVLFTFDQGPLPV